MIMMIDWKEFIMELDNAIKDQGRNNFSRYDIWMIVRKKGWDQKDISSCLRWLTKNGFLKVDRDYNFSRTDKGFKF